MFALYVSTVETSSVGTDIGAIGDCREGSRGCKLEGSIMLFIIVMCSLFYIIYLFY